MYLTGHIQVNELILFIQTPPFIHVLFVHSELSSVSHLAPVVPVYNKNKHAVADMSHICKNMHFRMIKQNKTKTKSTKIYKKDILMCGLYRTHAIYK